MFRHSRNKARCLTVTGLRHAVPCCQIHPFSSTKGCLEAPKLPGPSNFVQCAQDMLREVALPLLLLNSISEMPSGPGDSRRVVLL